MVSACLRISNSSSPLLKPLGMIQSTPIIIGINVTFMFHCVFGSLAMSKYFSLFWISLIFHLWSTGTATFTIRQLLFFLLIICTFGRQTGIRWSVCIWKFKRILCVSFSGTDSGLCIYYFGCMVKFQFLAQFPMDHLPHPLSVCWGCRIHRLLLSRGLRLPQRVSWLWD